MPSWVLASPPLFISAKLGKQPGQAAASQLAQQAQPQILTRPRKEGSSAKRPCLTDGGEGDISERPPVSLPLLPELCTDAYLAVHSLLKIKITLSAH